jgi:hypothetical protein
MFKLAIPMIRLLIDKFILNKLKNQLKEIISSHIINNPISPDVALISMLEFYKNHSMKSKKENGDDDMLLFQYGLYDWDGNGERFELNLTRQIADQTKEEYYQIMVTINYEATVIGKIESFTLWSIDHPILEEWEKQIMNTEGFKRASSALPLGYKVTMVKV